MHSFIGPFLSVHRAFRIARLSLSGIYDIMPPWFRDIAGALSHFIYFGTNTVGDSRHLYIHALKISLSSVPRPDSRVRDYVYFLSKIVTACLLSLSPPRRFPEAICRSSRQIAAHHRASIKLRHRPGSKHHTGTQHQWNCWGLLV